MDYRSSNLDEETLTAERAVDWLNRLETPDPQAKEAFIKWLNRSPQNGGETIIATSTDLVMRQIFRNKRIDVDQFLAASANVLSLADAARSKGEPSSRKRRLRLFAVAGLGIAAATATLVVSPTFVRNWLHPNEYTTSIGEQRAIALPDGSVIAINAQSSLRVDYSANARDVYLRDGQAMFTVAKDAARPFRVHVDTSDDETSPDGDTVIQALGTKFDVRRRSERINVAVIEGVVQIRSDAPQQAAASVAVPTAAPAKVAAGQAVSIESTGTITSPAPVNASDVSAWQQRRLVFADNTLAEITDEFQRYNRTPRIRIESEELRTQRFSGVFDADYPEALLMYLATDHDILVDRNGDDVVIRPRPIIVQSQPDTSVED